MKSLLSIDELQKSRWPDIFQKAFGDNLISAFVHGSCLMEGFDALREPWTVSFILKDNGTAKIEAVRSLQKDAQKENIQFLYIFSSAEILKSLNTFPLEYLHIANRSVALAGITPLSGFIPQKAALRSQCIRELRGTLIHLRKDFIQTKSERKQEVLFQQAMEESYPLLYGTYFLLTGKYPECHKDILDRYPGLAGKSLMESLEAIANEVESLE